MPPRMTQTAPLTVLIALLGLAAPAPAPAAPLLPETGDFQMLVDRDLETVLAAINAGRLDVARDLLVPVLALRPDLAAAHELDGILRAQDGDASGAIAAFERAVTLNPGQASAMTKLGDVHRALGARDTARNWFERALEVAPDDRLTHQRLGQLSEEAGDIAAAIRHYEAGIVSTAPQYLGVKLNLALLYNMTGQADRALALLAPLDAPGQPALFHRALANAHLASGDIAAALAGYARALELEPRDAASGLGLAEAAVRSGDPGRAVAVLTPMLEGVPADHGLRMALARSHRAAGDDAAALAVLRAGVALSDETTGGGIAGLHMEIGEILMQGGDLDGAEHSYRAARAAAPDQPAPMLALGTVLGARRDYVAALAEFEAGLAINPDNPLLQRGAIGALVRLDRQGDALGQARALAAHPAATAQDMFLLGILEEGAGQPEAAAAAYRVVIEANADHWGALNNLAMVELRRDAPGQALPLAERAHALSPGVAAVVHTLGLVRLRLDDMAAADPLLRAAAEAEPANPTILRSLAELEARQGDRAAAAQALAAALAAGLPQAEADRMRGAFGIPD